MGRTVVRNHGFFVVTVLVWHNGVKGFRLYAGEEQILEGPDGEQFRLAFVPGIDDIRPEEFERYAHTYQYGQNVPLRRNAPGRVYRRPATGCFSGDTPIALADGSFRPIRDVRVGDEVRSTDGVAGPTAFSRVTDVVVEESNEQVEVELSDGGALTMSPHQPLVTNCGPVNAEWLASDASLRDSKLYVRRVTRRAAPSLKLYSLELEYGDPYFVHSDPIQAKCDKTVGPGCLVAGTFVLMGDGRPKAIGAVKPGDELLTSDGSGADPRPTIVAGTRVTHEPVIIRITLSNGLTINCSRWHPVVTIAGPVAARDVFPDARVITRGGPAAAVTNVDVIFEPADVFWLELSEKRAFLIGDPDMSVLGGIEYKP